MEDVPLFTSLGGVAHRSCKVPVTVLLSILDHHSRRQEHQDRVIGTLVGFDHDGVIEIRNSFPVTHTEDDQVGVDMAFHKTMLNLHRKVSPKEVVVGWYSTGGVITEASLMIHDFYAREMTDDVVKSSNKPDAAAAVPLANPLHLTVDTTLANDSMAVKAWSHARITLNDKELGSHFLPVPLDVATSQHDRIGLEAIKPRAVGGKSAVGVHGLADGVDGLRSSLRRLAELVDTCSDYVKKVMDGTIPGDESVGRQLLAAMAALPKLEPAALERLVQNNVQDLLLLVYLANLTKTQLQIAEKLTKSV